MDTREAILAQAIPCSNVVLCARRVLFVSCSLVRRRSMPRRGWSSLPVPDGWFEVIRGPRPPSVQWPHQQKGKSNGVAPAAAPRGRWPQSESPSTDPRRSANTSFSGRGRLCRSGESSEVGTSSRSVGRGFWTRVPDTPELSEEGKSSRTRCSTWGPVGTVSEIRRKIGEAVASPRRRAREGGQVVGGSETTCGTFAFRVGSRETTAPPTNGSFRLRTGIGSVESLRGGTATRTRRSARTVVDAQSWEEQVTAQSITRSSAVAAFSGGKSQFVECDGDVDRQCGVVCQVEPPIQPHVNLWCRE